MNDLLLGCLLIGVIGLPWLGLGLEYGRRGGWSGRIVILSAVLGIIVSVIVVFGGNDGLIWPYQWGVFNPVMFGMNWHLDRFAGHFLGISSLSFLFHQLQRWKEKNNGSMRVSGGWTLIYLGLMNSFLLAGNIIMLALLLFGLAIMEWRSQSILAGQTEKHVLPGKDWMLIFTVLIVFTTVTVFSGGLFVEVAVVDMGLFGFTNWFNVCLVGTILMGCYFRTISRDWGKTTAKENEPIVDEWGFDLVSILQILTSLYLIFRIIFFWLNPANTPIFLITVLVLNVGGIAVLLTRLRNYRNLGVRSWSDLMLLFIFNTVIIQGMLSATALNPLAESGIRQSLWISLIFLFTVMGGQWCSSWWRKGNATLLGGFGLVILFFWFMPTALSWKIIQIQLNLFLSDDIWRSWADGVLEINGIGVAMIILIWCQLLVYLLGIGMLGGWYLGLIGVKSGRNELWLENFNAIGFKGGWIYFKVYHFFDKFCKIFKTHSTKVLAKLDWSLVPFYCLLAIIAGILWLKY